MVTDTWAFPFLLSAATVVWHALSDSGYRSRPVLVSLSGWGLLAAWLVYIALTIVRHT